MSDPPLCILLTVPSGPCLEIAALIGIDLGIEAVGEFVAGQRLSDIIENPKDL
jgi:hypothetical protein